MGNSFFLLEKYYSRYLKQCCSFSALGQALNVAQVLWALASGYNKYILLLSWPTAKHWFASQTSFPKCASGCASHSSNSWQLWKKTQIPALRAAQPQANPLLSKGHFFHISRAALFLVLQGQKYTKITALPLQQLSKLFCPHANLSAHSISVSSLQQGWDLANELCNARPGHLLLPLKHSLICSASH